MGVGLCGRSVPRWLLSGPCLSSCFAGGWDFVWVRQSVLPSGASPQHSPLRTWPGWSSSSDLSQDHLEADLVPATSARSARLELACGRQVDLLTSDALAE